MVSDIEYQIFQFVSSQKALLSLSSSCKYFRRVVHSLLSRRLKLTLLLIPGEIDNFVTQSFIQQGNEYIDNARFIELIELHSQLKNMRFNIQMVKKAFIRLSNYATNEIFLRTIKIGSSPASYPMDDLALFINPKIRNALGIICENKLRCVGLDKLPYFRHLVRASYHLSDPVSTIQELLNVVLLIFSDLATSVIAVIAALDNNMDVKGFQTWIDIFSAHPLFTQDTYDIEHFIPLLPQHEPYCEIEKFSTSKSVLLATTMINHETLSRRLSKLLEWKSLFAAHADDILWECQGPGFFQLMKLNDGQFDAFIKSEPHPSDIFDSSFICQHLTPSQIAKRSIFLKHPNVKTFLFSAKKQCARRHGRKSSKARFFSFEQYEVIKGHLVLSHPLYSMFSKTQLKILKQSISEQLDGHENAKHWVVPSESFVADILLVPSSFLKYIQIPAEKKVI